MVSYVYNPDKKEILIAVFDNDEYVSDFAIFLKGDKIITYSKAIKKYISLRVGEQITIQKQCLNKDNEFESGSYIVRNNMGIPDVSKLMPVTQVFLPKEEKSNPRFVIADSKEKARKKLGDDILFYEKSFTIKDDTSDDGIFIRELARKLYS